MLATSDPGAEGAGAIAGGGIGARAGTGAGEEAVVRAGAGVRSEAAVGSCAIAGIEACVGQASGAKTCRHFLLHCILEPWVSCLFWWPFQHFLEQCGKSHPAVVFPLTALPL